MFNVSSARLTPRVSLAARVAIGIASLASFAVSSTSRTAFAQEHGAATPELPAPTPPGTPGTSTIVAPPGSGGLTVVAPTAGGGSVTASGCSVVTVGGNPTYVLPDGSPCPQYAPYQPYQPYATGASASGPRYYDDRPRYARDSDRSAAIVASSLVFGIGGGTAGIMYLGKHGDERCTSDYNTGGAYYSTSCTRQSATNELVMYGAIVTLAPSIPRFIVGDTTRALIYTGLRGASILAASLIDWGSADTNWEGPFMLGFVAPITLAIVDLATTPHREDLEDKAHAPVAGIQGISPVPLADRNGTHGALMSMTGTF